MQRAVPDVSCLTRLTLGALIALCVEGAISTFSLSASLVRVVLAAACGYVAFSIYMVITFFNVGCRLAVLATLSSDVCTA